MNIKNPPFEILRLKSLLVFYAFPRCSRILDKIRIFEKISTQEPLPPKQIPVDKIKTNFIMRNDLLKYLGQEKSLKAAEEF